MPDGTVTTDSSHDLRADAVIRAKEIDVETARDTFIDPRGGRITLADWVPIWETTHQAGPATWAAYRSHLRLHILPALGPLPLVDIRRQHVKTLAVALGKRLSPRSVADVIMVLSMVLQEAVEDRRIPFNPCRGVRIPKGIRAERPHATAEQVAAIVARQARTSDGLLILTAAYTGMRWGAGVRGIYSHVTEPMITNVVDALQRRWETTQPDRSVDIVRRLRAVA
ncbi:tyrosine-type recombinase/integrase [Micromonospora trifolii]|uniref:tyrosine-type recombinase/integrase n=1 Tax=Micromonospora trifolii TaxID=2911208 RepID=UPI003CEE740E